VVYFQARGNLEFPQGHLFHCRTALGGPLQKGVQEDFGVAAYPGAAPDAQDFHGFLLEKIYNNIKMFEQMSRGEMMWGGFQFSDKNLGTK
jgi:hypothetical protein